MRDGPGKHEGWDAQWSREHLDERLTRQHLIAESVGRDAQPARLDCTYDNTFRRLGCTAVRAIGCKRPLIVVIRLLLGDMTLQSGGSKWLSTSQTLHRNSPHNCSEVHVSREAGGGPGVNLPVSRLRLHHSIMFEHGDPAMLNCEPSAESTGWTPGSGPGWREEGSHGWNLRVRQCFYTE